MHLRTKSLLFAGVLAIALVQAPAMAQEEVAKEKMIAALQSVAGGTCPEKLMSPLLLEQCEQQLGLMQQALTRMGSIQEARYRGIEPLPTGAQAEVYRVVFSRGTMIWMAALGPSGKLSVLWSPG